MSAFPGSYFGAERRPCPWFFFFLFFFFFHVQRSYNLSLTMWGRGNRPQLLYWTWTDAKRNRQKIRLFFGSLILSVSVVEIYRAAFFTFHFQPGQCLICRLLVLIETDVIQRVAKEHLWLPRDATLPALRCLYVRPTGNSGGSSILRNEDERRII